MMAQFQLFVMFIVFRTCHGALQCKHVGCGESTSRYTEPYESQSVTDEIPYMISPEDFYYKFVAKHRPLVLRKTATNWPANKIWTEKYLIQALNKLGSQVLATKRIQDFPFGPKLHMPVEEFFVRSVQDDLTLCDKPTSQMLNDITAPLCLRCQQFLKNMKVQYWLRRYQSKASMPLFFHPDEQLLTVVNGSAKVTLVSPLYSEKLPFDDKELMVISSVNPDILSKLSSGGIPHLTVELHKGDMLYIPQMWWQHITLSADNNLLVQFSWPSQMQTNSYPKSSSESKDKQLNMQALLRGLLRKYEERLLMMDVPLLDCPQQDKRMSDFTFETGKMTPEEYQAIHNGPDFTEEEVCNFDMSNQKSPCHFGSCFEDPEAPTCIRYILEYCSRWEDRGCTIELPQLLNKVDNYTMERITNMKSPYLHVN
ncbi:lysine-specific demethylase 8-like [Orbicella faveolata]|uniref:lysine-specific demethylase 8-like n=1 Tax=Orbicella faveolata TaxID=48498 RepID=UPI0009E4C969|nr:lysine-specific demethylase 8-like [Orbicella faveolata]